MQFNPRLVALVVGLLAGHSIIACDLKVEDGWIREAPAAAPSIAAYAVLRNDGIKAVEITAISTNAAAMTMLHESTVSSGMAQMRMLPSLKILAGGKVTLAPGGKHLMLTDPKNVPVAGEHIIISFTDTTGCVTDAVFTVRTLVAD